MKRSMRKSLGRNVLTLLQLQTITKEIEAIINTRPLLYNDDDVNTVTLTPANLLGNSTQHGSPELASDMREDPDYGKLSSRDELISKWKASQTHLTNFWKVWESEYLLSLRERYQQQHKQPRSTSQYKPRVNAVVLIKEEKVGRGSWKLARVTELTESSDGEIRTARLS